MLIYNSKKTDSPHFTEKFLIQNTRDLNFSNNLRIRNTKQEKKDYIRNSKFYEYKRDFQRDYLHSPKFLIEKIKQKKLNYVLTENPSRRNVINNQRNSKNLENNENNDFNELKETTSIIETSDLKNEMQNNIDSLVNSMRKSYLITNTKMNYNTETKTTFVDTGLGKKVNRAYYLKRIKYLTKTIWEEDYNNINTNNNTNNNSSNNQNKIKKNEIILPVLNSPNFKANANKNFKLKQEEKHTGYNCEKHRKIYCCYDSIFSEPHD